MLVTHFGDTQEAEILFALIEERLAFFLVFTASARSRKFQFLSDEFHYTYKKTRNQINKFKFVRFSALYHYKTYYMQIKVK